MRISSRSNQICSATKEFNRSSNGRTKTVSQKYPGPAALARCSITTGFSVCNQLLQLLFKLPLSRLSLLLTSLGDCPIQNTSFCCLNLWDYKNTGGFFVSQTHRSKTFLMGRHKLVISLFFIIMLLWTAT